MTELLKSMTLDYKNKGERVDEVLYHEVMEVVEQVEELEDILERDYRQEVLESMYEENKRLRTAIENAIQMIKDATGTQEKPTEISLWNALLISGELNDALEE